MENRFYKLFLAVMCGLLLWPIFSSGVAQANADVVSLPPLPFTKASMAVRGIEPPTPLAALETSRAISADEEESRAAPDASTAVQGRLAAVDVESSPAVAAARASGEKWIEVNLSEQKVYAYEGTEQVNEFVVSTGLPGTPTVTGEFRMWARTPMQDMSGGNRAAGNYYYLKDVKWVQYFYQSYGFHGTYWHNNFGNPMSRGCVNMTNDDAQWLFDWAFPQWDEETGWFKPTEENATLVIVHE
jgi:lipoprotein-anchoring transpeptidase ErfK/SrfK